MAIDNRTTGRNYPLPHPSNLLAEDVQRLREALTAIDADVFARYTKTEVDTLIDNLIGGAPGALNTLDELAAALSDDANFAATVTNLLALKANLADVWTRAQADARYVQGVTQTENVFTGNGSQTSFTLTQAPPTRESLLVTVDGVVQPTTEYNLSGATLTLSEAPANGSKIRVLMLGVAGPVQSASTLSFTQAGAGAVTRTVDSKLKDVVSVKDFGAVGNGTTDDTVAIQNACNAAVGKLLLLEPGATYKCTSQVHVKGNVDGQGATLKFYGTAISYLVYQNSMGSLRNFIIDGANVSSCQCGLQVDTDFAFTGYCNYDLIIQNISNSDNTQPCTGAQFFKSSSATNLNSYLDVRIQVRNIVATADGVVGLSAGKATGILVGFNASGTDSNIVVHDSTVDTVSSGGSDPAEDADGIHMLIAGHDTLPTSGLIEIKNCVVKNAKKRGYKIQASNVVVENCICYGQSTLAGFETYAYNTTFSNCKHLQGTGVAFTTSQLNSRFVGCYAEGSGAVVDLVRVYNGANEASFENCLFASTASYASTDYGVVQIYAASNVRISNTNLKHNGNLGCSLLLRNSATITIQNCIFSGSQAGINFAASNGRLIIADSEISAFGSCMARAGNSAQSVYARDCRFSTSGSATVIGLWNSGGDNSAYGEFNNCTILSNGAGGGAWVSAPSRVTNCRVEQQGAQAGIGIYFPGNACVARNNQIANFSTGISARYATNQEIADNVTITCATPYDLTGSTPLVNVDNFSR